MKKTFFAINGYIATFFLVALFMGVTYQVFNIHTDLITKGFITIVVFLICFVIFMISAFTIKPYETKVANMLGGKYVGEFNKEGFYYTNPFYSLESINLAVQNLQTNVFKITDSSGKPIDVSVIIKWKVVDTYKAYFSLNDYKDYVAKQTEAITRSVLKKHKYLDMSKDEVLEDLGQRLNTDMQEYGLNVIQCELGALSYASEIANAMLQKQQAEAVIEARKEMVQGTIDIINDFNKKFNEEKIELSKDDKSKMISNLVIVMMSKEHTQPVINV